jgi:dienelactone hydrolase
MEYPLMLRRLGNIAIVPALFAVVAGCESRPATGRPAPSRFADAVSGPRDEDYAKARAAYASKVTWSGHAPVAARPTQPKDLVAKGAKGPEELPYSSDGLSLRAFVTPDPGDGEKHPAVVFLGAGFNLDRRGWDLASEYAKAGFVALAPMPRGENQQKGVYTTFYREVDDVLAATEALAKLPYVDASRVYLAGVREGGTQALLCAMASGRFKAVAAIHPVLDIAAFANENRYLVAFDRRDVREFQLRSPLAYATSLKCPARVYAPAGDAEAEAAAQELAQRAKGKAIDAEAESVPVPRPSATPRPAAAGKFAAPPRPPTIDAEAVRRSIEFFRSQSARP